MLSGSPIPGFGLILLFYVLSAAGQKKGSSSTPTISVPTSTITVLYGYRYSWIYESWVPDAARRKLEPIYERQTEALLELNAQAPLDTQELAWDFLAAAYGASGITPNSPATKAKTEASHENNTGGQIYARDGQTLRREIADEDVQIQAIRTEYGIGETIGPPDKPFDADSLLSGEELAKAFLLLSDPSHFESAFDQSQQANASLDNSLQELRSKLNDIANGVVSLKSETRGLEAKMAAAQQSSGTMDSSIPIPPGWVPCTCPDRHPNAGPLINGARYHSAALDCSQYY